ncbi:MAG: hypothetical protein COA81_01405 [Alphaproteobacteria bacterium]|nr:MAG: hypothetical protein COA81_01405 [Alphaproteobacteria bacterium]
MTIAQAITDYESRLQKMIEDMAAQIVSGAQTRVVRNLKSPNANSPLAQSIRATKDPDGTMRVFTDKPYARYVEFGTLRQPPRPFLTPATEEVKVTFRGLI